MSAEIGPDRILPADGLSTSQGDGCVKLRIEKEGPNARKPISLLSFFKERCAKGGDHTALRVKRQGEWTEWSYSAYYRDARTAGKAFVALGLERFHAVSIYSFNCPEWFFSTVGAISAGGFSNGLYPTNSADMNEFIMRDSKTDILVVEDDAALDKIWAGAQNVASIRKVVQIVGQPKRPGVLSWEELMEIGRRQPDEVLERVERGMAVNQCATLIYTSGTTGAPKGVMLSHDNIIFPTVTCIELFNWREFKESVVSYLPLSHIAGLLFDLWACLGGLSTVHFADKTALKGSLLQYLTECRPTSFFGVPRVYEKIMEGMRAKAAEIRGLKKKLSAAAKAAGLQHHLEGKNPAMYKVGQKVIYPKVREALGLDRCVRFFSGAAPLGEEALKYFLSLDIEIWQVYGMSETSGPHIVCWPGENKFMSVGKTLPPFRTRLANEKDGEGEVCMWGRNIMMGYLNREDKTNEDLDPEGWMHSGDLGVIDQDKFVTISGRIKELIITAGGENVAPIPIEDLIKEELPLVSNAILIGDKKKFLTVFLTLKTELDNATEMPTRELTVVARNWCETLGRKVVTVDDILNGPDPVIMSAIQGGIDRANKKAVSNAARVQKWTILPMDLSINGGELGPTMKLKRFAFNKKYADAVDRFYL